MLRKNPVARDAAVSELATVPGWHRSTLAGKPEDCAKSGDKYRTATRGARLNKVFNQECWMKGRFRVVSRILYTRESDLGCD